ncbi:uncharacterized protein LTR77_010811 [Saxophila tyrrhenica]|uniref:Bacteriophage T5 Orf172 DNA-binding domain-containing protein n=1 Tax=Saxophila tyrrhenica TaxID=1690608 RepID=A0AAV9NWW1_9PEZI|nr:hypothetical protein LTR77_010811 [Saxophila tyrrhenica]
MARNMMQSSADRLTLRDIRNLICLLMCADHQYNNYNYKNQVEAAWSLEFPSLDFRTRKHPSPYSLKSGIDHVFNAAPANAPITPPSSGQRPQDTASSRLENRQSPPPRINLHPGSKAGPSIPDTPPSSEEDSPANEDADETEVPESPLVARASRCGRADRHPDGSAGRREASLNEIPAPLMRIEQAASSILDVVEEVTDASTDTNSTLTQPEATPPSAHVGEQIQASAVAEEATPVTLTATDEDTPTSAPQATQGVSAVASPALSSTPDLATSDGRFSPVDASTWAPCTIRSEVLTLLLEPLPRPRAKGAIYAVSVNADDSTPMVKIGYTTRPVRTRLREITNQHGITFNRNTAYYLPGIPLLQLLRLEALVHADLAFFQRDLRVQHGRAHRTHREYFEVDLSVAQRTINRWWAIMRDIGLEPGQDLDQAVVDAIHGSQALDVEVADAEATTTEPDVWHRLNLDHQRREHVWNVVFRRDSGGFRMYNERSGVTWLFMALVLLMLPDVLNCPPRVVYALAAVLYWLFWHWRIV